MTHVKDLLTFDQNTLVSGLFTFLSQNVNNTVEETSCISRQQVLCQVINVCFFYVLIVAVCIMQIKTGQEKKRWERKRKMKEHGVYTEPG